MVKIPCTQFLQPVWTKSRSTDGGHTDRQTDRLKPITPPPPKEKTIVCECITRRLRYKYMYKHSIVFFFKLDI